jgi:hypothetical protein
MPASSRARPGDEDVARGIRRAAITIKYRSAATARATPRNHDASPNNSPRLEGRGLQESNFDGKPS